MSQSPSELTYQRYIVSREDIAIERDYSQPLFSILKARGAPVVGTFPIVVADGYVAKKVDYNNLVEVVFIKTIDMSFMWSEPERKDPIVAKKLAKKKVKIKKIKTTKGKK